MKKKQKQRLGFIGQGWIGKNYADYYEEQGFDVVRYAKDFPYSKNKKAISECDIVFIAVPTPTTPEGFDDSILESVIGYVGKGKVALIKSTIIPGTTEKMQAKYSDKIILHSPEFLMEISAAHNARNPERNIIGYANERGREIANQVLRIFPEASYSAVMPAKEAEIIKYAGNCFLYTKVMFANLLYDLADKLGLNYENIKEALGADSRIGDSHLQPVHFYKIVDESRLEVVSNIMKRGAGGHCFIKDFAAFNVFYKKYCPDDKHGHGILDSLEQKNLELLLETEKDLDLVRGVYGEL